MTIRLHSLILELYIVGRNSKIFEAQGRKCLKNVGNHWTSWWVARKWWLHLNWNVFLLNLIIRRFEPNPFHHFGPRFRVRWPDGAASHRHDAGASRPILRQVPRPVPESACGRRRPARPGHVRPRPAGKARRRQRPETADVRGARPQSEPTQTARTDARQRWAASPIFPY